MAIARRNRFAQSLNRSIALSPAQYPYWMLLRALESIEQVQSLPAHRQYENDKETSKAGQSGTLMPWRARSALQSGDALKRWRALSNHGCGCDWGAS